MAPRQSHLFGRPIGLVAIAAYKLVWGAMEIGAGVLLVFSQRLITGELAEDPTDRFARWLLSHTWFDYTRAAHLGILFILLGAFKILLFFGIWYRSMHFRYAILAVSAGVAAFGAYELIVAFSAYKLALLVAEAFIVVYLWKILPTHAGEPHIE